MQAVDSITISEISNGEVFYLSKFVNMHGVCGVSWDVHPITQCVMVSAMWVETCILSLNVWLCMPLNVWWYLTWVETCVLSHNVWWCMPCELRRTSCHSMFDCVYRVSWDVHFISQCVMVSAVWVEPCILSLNVWLCMPLNVRWCLACELRHAFYHSMCDGVCHVSWDVHPVTQCVIVYATQCLMVSDVWVETCVLSHNVWWCMPCELGRASCHSMCDCVCHSMCEGVYRVSWAVHPVTQCVIVYATQCVMVSGVWVETCVLSLNVWLCLPCELRRSSFLTWKVMCIKCSSDTTCCHSTLAL